MKKSQINEVKQLQKIAGITEIVVKPTNMDPASFEEVLESPTFNSVMDGGDWNYDRFGFGEVNGRCYMLELEGSESQDDVSELKKGLTVKKIISQGKQKGFFDIQGTDIFYEEDQEDEMNEWLNSLKI